MSKSFFDSPGRGSRDRAGYSLPDEVAALNRVYVDEVTLPTDLVRQFPKEERAGRTVLVYAALPEETAEIVLAGGYKLLLDTEGTLEPASTRELVVRLTEAGAESAPEVLAAVAAAVNGWTSLFQAVVTAGGKLGIYDVKGRFAVVSNTAGWTEATEEAVPLMRPGLPAECIPGSYHPGCPYLMLVKVTQGAATDTHTNFTRQWQADLRRLGECESVMVEALLKQGMLSGETVEQEVMPPRQFLPWVKTRTSSRKTPRGSAAEGGADADATDDPGYDVMQSVVTPENLAGSALQTVRAEHGAPVALVAETLDADTGEIRQVRQEVVPAETAAGTPLNASGGYQEVQPVNPRWSIRTTLKAAGLAGQAQNGVKEREYHYQDNYHWPRVLDYIDIRMVLSDPGDAYSAPEGFNWRPVWKANHYSGPCTCKLVERWTSKQPMLRGNPDWNTTTGPDPEDPENEMWLHPKLHEATVMQPQEIEFRGQQLDIHIPECLHSGVRIWDSQFFQEYPPTTPMRWPASILTRVTLTPDQGGWLTREFWVDAPLSGTGSGVELWQATAAARAFTVEWQGQAPLAGGQEVLLTVATDPAFESGFLGGYHDLDVTAAEDAEPTEEDPDAHPRRVQVTGVERGRIYYVRVVRGGITSNTCVCSARPQPEVAVLKSLMPRQEVQDATVDFGPVRTGTQGRLMRHVLSAGLQALREIRVLLTGEQAGVFRVVSDVPAYLEAGATAELELEFAPVSVNGGSPQSCTLEITSNAADAYELTLTGAGSAPVIQVEQPAASAVAPGGTVSFGTLTAGSTQRTFWLRNAGNAALEDLALELGGENAQDFQVTTDLAETTLEAGGLRYFVVTFSPKPDANAPDARAALLGIRSSDEAQNPYEIHLQGTYQDPAAPGVPDGWDPQVNGAVRAVAVQADGKVIIGGEFTAVGATPVTRNRLARLDAETGAADSFDPDADGTVRALAVQPDGKILVGGEFTMLGATARNRLARLAADGTVEVGFDPDVDGPVHALALQADGKILLGGVFTEVAGGARTNLARLLADGTLDTGFIRDLDGEVNGIVVMNDGGILVVGDSPEATPEPDPTPTPTPTGDPTPDPTPTGGDGGGGDPCPEPSAEPSPDPSEEPSPEPSASPSPDPSEEPSPEPSPSPSPEPSPSPSPEPSPSPCPCPTE